MSPARDIAQIKNINNNRIASFMHRPYIPFVAFLILLVLLIPFSFDFSTSVVPGWHTTIFPPYFVATFLLIIILRI
jgi:hypothetical protein